MAECLQDFYKGVFNKGNSQHGKRKTEECISYCMSRKYREIQEI